jgi:hypothetical protein
MKRIGGLRRSAARVVVVLLVALASGCSGGGRTANIDFLDLVHLGGKDFYNRALIPSDCATPGGPELSPSDLGQVVATTRVNLGKTGNADHHPADGDAGQLPAGTKLYAVAGFTPDFRLAAHKEDRLTLYELADNPAARQGRDLVDLTGTLVGSIALSAPSDNPLSPPTPLAVIDEPTEVAQMVEMTLTAPVDTQAQRSVNDKRYCITFRLQHGPWISRPYFPGLGVLGLTQVLAMPPGFRSAVDAAIAGSKQTH